MSMGFLGPYVPEDPHETDKRDPTAQGEDRQERPYPDESP